MKLYFPVNILQPVIDRYLPFSKKIYFAFDGNGYLFSSLSDGRILPNKVAELILEGGQYVIEIDTNELAAGFHKGKPVIPTQTPEKDGRVAVNWVDCPANPPEPFRQETKRHNWEFLT